MKKNTLLSLCTIATVIIALIGYNSLLKGAGQMRMTRTMQCNPTARQSPILDG